MARKNRPKGTPQHGRGHKTPRSYHRNVNSPTLRKDIAYLEKLTRPLDDQEKAA